MILSSLNQRVEDLSQLASSKVEGLLHPSAHANALSLHRHKSFIQSHLMGGLIALLMYPLYLYRVGAPGFRTEVIDHVVGRDAPEVIIRLQKASGHGM